MDRSPHRILMAGLPETGKTSFLAALWHVLESGEAVTALRLVSGPANRSYLNEIRRQWSEGTPVSHTSPNRNESIELTLQTMDGDGLTLVLPDLSGEAFRDLWTKRIWHPQLETFCDDLDAIALFLHPTGIMPPSRVDQANALLMAAGARTTSSAQPQAIPPFDPEKSSTATKLAYILQALKSRSAKPSLPVAVIVSAWDLVPGPATPATWLAKELPMIDQLLRANQPEQPFAVFGISALGGDLRNEQARDRLLNYNDASRRVLVTDGLLESTDISRPLRWLVSQRQ